MSFLTPISSELMAAQGWARSLFSLRSLVGGLKTLSWLVPVTLVIWFYGERQQFEVRPSISVHINIRSSNPANTYVDFADKDKNKDNNLVVELRGPANQLDGLIKSMQDPPTDVMLTIPDNLPSDVNYESAIPLLSASDMFKKYPAVEIRSCTPDDIRVYADKIDEHTFEVRPKTPEALDGPAIFNPSHVTVKAPRRSFSPEISLHPEANFVIADLSALKAAGGSRQLEGTVPVFLPGLINERPNSVTYSPSTVDAQFTPKPADATFTYPSIPVYVVARPDFFKDVKVDCEPNFTGVTVVGPADKIAALSALKDSKDLPRPWALVELQITDLTRKDTGSFLQQIRYDHMPDPQIQISPKDESRTINVTITSNAQ